MHSDWICSAAFLLPALGNTDTPAGHMRHMAMTPVCVLDVCRIMKGVGSGERTLSY